MNVSSLRLLTVLPVLVALSCPVRAVEDGAAAAARVTKKEPVPTKGMEMIYGPVLGCSVQFPSAGPITASNPAPPMLAGKGIVVRLGNGEATVCFDTETLQMK